MVSLIGVRRLDRIDFLKIKLKYFLFSVLNFSFSESSKLKILMIFILLRASLIIFSIPAL